MRLELNPNEGNLGFQIAPMIDVVFVIMLFFMVMAGAVKVENELNTQFRKKFRARTLIISELVRQKSERPWKKVTLKQQPTSLVIHIALRAGW